MFPSDSNADSTLLAGALYGIGVVETPWYDKQKVPETTGEVDRIETLWVSDMVGL